MNYTEWRDELNNNLLGVSESERRRVLDYYAEAYADRREAGFTEREIINGFGAPYDAAQRILSEKGEDFTPPRRETPPPPTAAVSAPPPPPPPAKKESTGWVFVLLCVIFCVPLFGLILSIVIITVAFCCVPIIVIGTGATSAGCAVGTMIGGELAYGIFLMGTGLVLFGIGIILCPIFFNLVSLMWKLFKKTFCWLKSLFGGKGV